MSRLKRIEYLRAKHTNWHHILSTVWKGNWNAEFQALLNQYNRSRTVDKPMAAHLDDLVLNLDKLDLGRKKCRGYKLYVQKEQP